MKRTAYITLTVLLVLSASACLVKANGGTGQIRIEPHSSGYPSPIMLSSPATFNITVQTGSSYDPQILLVMTNASYLGLTGNVVVQWATGTVSFAPADFTMDDTNGNNVPSNGTTNGASYTVASLKDHIGVSGTADDAIWWALKSFLSGPITTTPTAFNITLPSTNPRMLVYALGKSSLTAELFDMKVPNTLPGLVVPEPATILATLASFAVLGLFAYRHKITSHTHKLKP